MVSKIKLFLTLVFLQALIVSAQINYYVSPSGNNSNSGSISSPWKTVQFAITIANSGDTLNLANGTFNEKINCTKSGLYIRNKKNESPIIDGAGILGLDAIFKITSQSNITVDGLVLANNIQNDAQGILIEGNSQNITIKNCKIHDIHFSANASAAVNANTNAQGIIVFGNNSSNAIGNLKIINNQLYNCRLGYSEGISVNGNVNNFEVIGNVVHDLTNIGIDAIGHEGTCSVAANDQAKNGLIKNNIVYNCLSAYATSGGIYVDGAKNIIIENNTSYHNGFGVEVGCEHTGKSADSIIVRNNIFYDNEVAGIALGGYAYPSGSGKVMNSSIRNNTCYYNDYSNAGDGELYLSYSENSIIENNIFYLNNQNTLVYAELTQPSLNFNYNIIYGDNNPVNFQADWNGIIYNSFSSFKTGSNTNLNSSIANPNFILGNTTAPNFHISATSAAINSGNPLFVSDLNEMDMDNENRKSGIVDCGADEYYSSTLVVENSLKNNIVLYPNPANENIFIKGIEQGNAIQIFDATGRLCLETKSNTNSSITISELNAGMYFVLVKTKEGNVMYSKFVKE